MSFPVPNIDDFISDPPTALLVIILMSAIVGAYRGWWVPSYLYKEMKDDVELQNDINERMVEALTELTKEIRQRRSGE